MNDIKLLSVVVPCYNVEGYLSRCLSSLVHQDIDGSAYEVIAIDDGSTDSTGEICDRYAKEYPQVKVVHQANRGVGAARNAGLDLARGKYLLFVDADDFMVENCFKELLKFRQVLNICRKILCKVLCGGFSPSEKSSRKND